MLARVAETRIIDHDAKPGALDRCQICGSGNLELVIDLGHQPPCDAYLTAAQLREPEQTYPLRLMQCQECTLAQLDYVVPAEKLYPAEYPYRAGISWPVVAAHKEMAAQLVDRFGIGLCVDIGSNDGTLLAQLKTLGCKVVGVEPTDIAEIAVRDNDVPTVKRFFGEEVGALIAKDCGKAHLITMTHVFAHIADLGEAMRGICALLAKDGVLVIENHYLLDVLERNQFDTIYHEHVRNYTLQSLVRLFEQYGMEVFDVERVARYGGNIRVFVSWAGERRPAAASVGKLLKVEAGSWTVASWAGWRDRIQWERQRFVEALHRVRVMEGIVAGCSAPGRASTLLNYYGVKPDLLQYTGELQDSLKLGKFIPGCHIPIVENRRLLKDQPNCVVLLAWHYADEIIKRLRVEGLKSSLIVPLPKFRVIDA